MKFLIEAYIKKRTEDLSFIQLGPGAIEVKNYEIPEEGLYVPLLTKDLAEKIKTKTEDQVITAKGIVEGIIYLLGIDSNFLYKDEYIKLLYAVNPNIEDYINYQAIKLSNEGQAIEGIIYLKALLLLNNENKNYLFNYALTVLKHATEKLNIKSKVYRDFKREALVYFERVLDIDEEFSLAYYHLGYLYYDKKQFNKAKLYWEKYIELDNKGDYTNEIKQMLESVRDKALYERGYEAVLGGRPGQGLPLLLNLEEKYTDWWNLLFFIGLAYRQIQDYKKAITYFNRVLELEKNQLDSLVEIGLCYGGLRDFNKSIQYFSKALDLGGENSEILCNLAMVHMEIGKYKKAREYLDHSLFLDPDDEITKACNERLNSLMRIN